MCFTVSFTENEDVDDSENEELRSMLLTDAYAGAFSGIDAMFLDAAEIKNADKDELRRIARRMGYEEIGK